MYRFANGHRHHALHQLRRRHWACRCAAGGDALEFKHQPVADGGGQFGGHFFQMLPGPSNMGPQALEQLLVAAELQ